MENSYNVPSKLLTTNNAKTIKGKKVGYTTYILYMNSYTQNSKGINLCSHASKGCASACLLNTGYGGFMNNVKDGRANKTEYYLADRVKFLNQLAKEITKNEIKHNKKNEKFAVRLNGTTDIRWEKFNIFNGKNIFELFPNVIFYDYTKNPKRMDLNIPNYHLTFSKSESNDEAVKTVLANGGNVAMVFDELPAEYMGYKVVNGDESDLRFLDDDNVIVGLKYKKLTDGTDNNLAFESGFAIRVNELELV
jgi:hypothetical protein